MVLVFDPARFNVLLGAARPGLGQNVLWEPSYLCPCRNPTSGAAEQGCPVCKGRGVVWQAPIAGWTGLAGMKIVREWAAFGQWEGGDVIITIPSDSPVYGVAESDRVTFTDSTEPFNAVIIGGVDILTFPAASIDQVVWRDSITKVIIQAGIPGQAEDGSLSWTTGPIPPTGQQYSIKGRRHQRYYCFQALPQERRHSAGLPLPRRVVLRLFDLFGR
jgi:hypothetical protein